MKKGEKEEKDKKEMLSKKKRKYITVTNFKREVKRGKMSGKRSMRNHNEGTKCETNQGGKRRLN